MAGNEIVVVGSAEPVSKKARRLDAAGLAYKYLGVRQLLRRLARRLALKMWTGRPTLPMVLRQGVLVGGASARRLLESGEGAGKR